MDDSYVYVSVKLYLAEGQTEDSIQEVIQEMDYSFTHDEIIGHEIIDILDMQLPPEEDARLQSVGHEKTIDVWSMD